MIYGWANVLSIGSLLRFGKKSIPEEWWEGIIVEVP